MLQRYTIRDKGRRGGEIRSRRPARRLAADRTRNDLAKTQRTQSNPNENGAQTMKRVDILPLCSAALEVPCSRGRQFG
jgi:hypothetical protein